MQENYMTIENAIESFKGLKLSELTCPKCGEHDIKWFHDTTSRCENCGCVLEDQAFEDQEEPEDQEESHIVNGVDYSTWQVGDPFEVNEYTLKHGIVCHKCKKRGATVGVSGLENGEITSTSWCDSCYFNQSHMKYGKKFGG